jgi:membrane protein required for colicin V production
MNWLDIVLIVIFAGAAFGGLIIGLIVAAFSLVGIIAGIVLAGHYYIPLSQHLGFFSSESVAQVVAFIIILVGVMLVAAALAFVLRWVAKLVKLGWIDRLGGAVLGLITGALLCAAVLALWVKFAGAGATITGSVLASVLLDGFPIILGLLPAEFDAVSAFFQ